MNERRKERKQRAMKGNQQISISTGKPLFSFGFYFVMYRSSRDLRLPCVVYYYFYLIKLHINL